MTCEAVTWHIHILYLQALSLVDIDTVEDTVGSRTLRVFEAHLP
jgi:hypothetical protein